MSADELKAEGNKLFAAKDFEGAVEKFSQAIEADPYVILYKSWYMLDCVY